MFGGVERAQFGGRTDVIPSEIVAVGKVNPVTVLQEIVQTLRNIGHRVTFFEDSKAFQAAGASLIDADVAVVAPRFACSRALMSSAPRLRGVVSPVTGIEGIDIAAATELGIIVANGQVRENTESMAEATVLLVLAALYDLHRTEAVLRDNLPRPIRMNARMLRGKTVGLIGFGQIARAMAVRLAGWDVVLQAYSRRRLDDAPAGVRFVELDALMSTSDIVCVLATLNHESRGLLTARRLRLLKRGAVLINTGRGAIIDEAALCQVAGERPDLRLALDTFTVEPLPSESKLREIPNAILTPHMVGHTQEAVDALPDTAVGNVTRILDGRLPVFVCNPAVADRWRDRWPAVSAG
jgi:phosphoglycerate dehydrogenase-like enzyme